MSSVIRGSDSFDSAGINACRAWVNFKGTDTVAINASGNVSSITDNGTGDYTVNFITNMPDANYCVSGSARSVDGKENLMFNLFASTTSLLVSGVRVTTTYSDTSGIHGNAETVCVEIHR